MNYTVTLQRGSDLVMSGVLRNADGTPINLTGYTVDLFEQSRDLNGSVTVTNAAQGEISIVAEWRDAWPSGRNMSFRVRIATGGRETAWPKVMVNIV